MKKIVVSSAPITWNGEMKRKLKTILSPEEMKLAESNSKKVSVERIRYLSGGHEVVGFVVKPKGKKKLPCLIFNRGGNREFSSIKSGTLFLTLARYASWGYVVVASQYSGNDGGEGKDEMGGKDINDVLVLRDVLKTVPNADVSRIGMIGGSRGGMMTYLALARVKWIKAAVTIAGLSDLDRNEKLRPPMKQVFKECFGGSNREKRKRSAIFWADKFSKKSPLLMLHGTADWRVSPLDSLDLSRELLKYHIPHRLVMFEGADHFLSESQEEKNRLIKDWFERFLILSERIPNVQPHGE